MLGMNRDVSIVIIGRNEGQRLVRCFESVRTMVGPEADVEIVYVDSGSEDGSVACARRFGASVIELQGRCSAARARNAGWQAANGEWILFLDGDTVLDRGFLDAALAHASDPQVAAVWGHRRELRPLANFYHRVLDLDWVYAPGVSEFCGGDVLMRRKALEQVQGFDPALIAGEEPELCSRLRGSGYQILHIDAPMTGHDLAITRFSQYWKRAVRAGYAYAQLGRLTRHYSPAHVDRGDIAQRCSRAGRCQSVAPRGRRAAQPQLVAVGRGAAVEHHPCGPHRAPLPLEGSRYPDAALLWRP